MLLTSDNQIRDLLGRTTRVAVIGLSSKPDRPSHLVAKALQAYGYEIAPVNPNESEVLGQVAYDNLAEVPFGVDLACVFRQPEFVSEIALTCVEKGVNALWLQEGVINQTAAQYASEHGIDVVMNRCMYKEYRRLFTEAQG